MSLSPIFASDTLRFDALTQADMPTLAAWMQDEAFARHQYGSVTAPKTAEALWQDVEKMQNSSTDFTFGVRHMQDHRLVGIVEIDGILWNHRVAGLAIGIAPQEQGKGYASEAMRLLINFAFYELNLYRVQLSVFAYNQAAIALYQKMGFVQEGILRQFIERNGQRYDCIWFGMLRDEWQKPD